MNTTFVFLVLLCIFLIVGLGINYGNIFSQTITNMNSFKPSTISCSKYNSMDDYYLDANASQGVFSNIVSFNNPVLDDLTNQNTPIVPSENDGGKVYGTSFKNGNSFINSFKEGLTTGTGLSADETTAIAAAKAAEAAAVLAQLNHYQKLHRMLKK